MLNDWKQAWREAVANFQRELHDAAPDDSPGNAAGGHSVRGMERELVSARGARGRLAEEIARAQHGAEAEREHEAVCRRRLDQATRVGDAETVRLATEYASRHAERAALLLRKVAVLEAERELLDRDIGLMQQAIGASTAAGMAGPAPAAADPLDERAFTRMERSVRERAAEARLEELKRKLRE